MAIPSFDIGEAGETRFTIVYVGYPWHVKFIHWWEGKRPRVTLVGEDKETYSIHASYDSLWTAIKLLFKK